MTSERPGEQRVSTLELFFDLVFVFAITQVTGLMADDPSWANLGRGMLVLAAIWWAWSAYAWLTNTVDPEQPTSRIVVFLAMGAMLIVALATPEAFGDEGVVFAVAYAVVRFLHIWLYAQGSPDVTIRTGILRLAPSSAIAGGLLLAAALVDDPVKEALWAIALLIDYGGPIVMGVAGLTVSPGHFAERFGLIVIIALGESIVAIGIGASGLELDAGLIAAALLGVAAAVGLWWVYFDVVALAAERTLREAQGDTRARLARDAYAYLHLPLIAGVVLLALGVKKTLENVDADLASVPAVALCGGVALYLITHAVMRLRVLRGVDPGRLVAALACLALIPLAMNVAALAALAAVAGICLVLVGYEATRFRETRARLRTAA
jgi:low temperature requirement protein LtrA